MERIWSFKTAQFEVDLAWEYERDPDLSWADDETLDKLDRGIYVNATFRVRVLWNGKLMSDQYLGNSVYEDVHEFRSHHVVGNAGSYFTDMVHEAIADARKALCDVPKLRCA